MDYINFQTRSDVCQYMVSLLPANIKTVLEPTPGKGNLISSLQQQGLEITAPDEFFSWVRSSTHTFDAVVMNPPFTPMKLGYQILDYCIELADTIIALMPWLTIINSERRTAKIKQFGLKSITHLPRNAFPGARVQTCILHMEKHYHHDTIFYIY